MKIRLTKQQKELLQSNKWVVSLSPTEDLCHGHLETIATEIAKRLVLPDYTNMGVSVFFISRSLENKTISKETALKMMAEYEKERAIREEEIKPERIKKFNEIVKECLINRKFQWDFIYDDEGDLIDYKEIYYAPHLSNYYMKDWDEQSEAVNQKPFRYSTGIGF